MIRRVFDHLQQIHEAKGRKAKLALIEDLSRMEELQEPLGEILRFAYDPYITFGVTPVLPVPAAPDGISDEALNDHWRKTVAILNRLRTRELSGKAAHDAVTSILTPLPTSLRLWFKGIIARDLRVAGVAAQTWSKFFSGLNIVSPHLCEPFDNRTIDQPYFCEPKFDGVRAVCIIQPAEEVTAVFLSREGKPLHNAIHIGKAAVASGLVDVVLDGELMADNYAETISITQTESVHPLAGKLKFHVFDILKLEDWRTGVSVIPLFQRKHALAAAVNAIDSPTVVLVESEVISTNRQAEENMATMLLRGYEGIVIKEMNSLYMFKRNRSWMKLKPTADADLEIIDALPGERGKQFEFSLGALVVSGTATYNRHAYSVRSEVGSGLTIEDRDKFWKMHKNGDLVGRIAEIKFQEPCTEKNRDQNEYSLRFPRFIRMRPDKTTME